MSLLVIRSTLEGWFFFDLSPDAKFHEDTNYELGWSSEFFFLVEWTRHFQDQEPVVHTNISTYIWAIYYFFSLFCSDLISNGMVFTILW